MAAPQAQPRSPALTGPEGNVRATRLEEGRGPTTLAGQTERSPFCYFRTSPEVIRLAVMLYMRFLQARPLGHGAT